QPSETMRDFLRGQIARIESSAAPIPSVFQHGDSGFWNLLSLGKDRIGFLDWENAEPRGMPLWDFYFFWSMFCVEAGSRAGKGSRLEAFEALLLQDTRYAQRFMEIVRDYAAQVGVAESLWEPFFYLCWLHQAVKQATWTALDQLQNA